MRFNPRRLAARSNNLGAGVHALRFSGGFARWQQGQDDVEPVGAIFALRGQGDASELRGPRRDLKAARDIVELRHQARSIAALTAIKIRIPGRTRVPWRHDIDSHAHLPGFAERARDALSDHKIFLGADV